VDDDMRLAVSYVDFCKRVAATSRERFRAEFPQVFSVIGCFADRSAAQAEADLFNLLQRHASAIENVLTSALQAHAAEAVRGDLPAGSLLSMCLSRSGIEVVPPSNYDAEAKAMIDRLSAPILEFSIDPLKPAVVFRGGISLEGANYRLVEQLLPDFRCAKAKGSDVPFVAPGDLAQRLGLEDQSMRQQLTRLRSALEPLVVSMGVALDQDSFIENRPRAGYRINPATRELALGDMR
jgi:hypothetical protein